MASPQQNQEEVLSKFENEKARPRGMRAGLSTKGMCGPDQLLFVVVI